MRFKHLTLVAFILLAAGIANAQSTDTQPPTAPANLTASATTNTVFLSWIASTDDIGVAKYVISRNGTQIGQNLAGTSTPSTIFIDSGLASSTPYVYSVVALDAAGNTSQPSTVSTSTASPPPGDTQAPTAPTGVHVCEVGCNWSSHPDYVDVNWYASTDNVGVKGYYIYRNGVQVANIPRDSRSDAAGYGWGVSHGTPTGMVYSGFSDLTTNGYTSYTYVVKAYDAAGNTSPPSNSPTLTTSIRSGAKVVTTARVNVYDNYQQKTIGTQPKGAAGSVTEGPKNTRNSSRGKITTYYYVKFSTGTSGWVDASNLQGVLAVADYQSPTLAIADMRNLLDKLATQLTAILAKIENLRAALAAAAAASSQ